ncbi:chromosome segregation protein SMC, partial [candidate division KSB1 bacterium]
IKIDQLIDRIFNLEEEISENKAEVEILNRRLEEYKVTDFSITEEIDLEKMETEVEDLKGKLDGVGLVNLLAEEDYQEEKERLDFLMKQEEDIIEAEKNLVETIEKIDIAAVGQFKETFELIRTNFIEVYQIFFEKGEADIRLVNEDDPLESPIGILSRPFGKKLMSTNQLSAGEKALTAISLLFGIYKVKPSPFCILDEVDAPLDESNTGRFLKALDSFSEDTQFIVVTHNKNTMEKASSLYGITMEETGVSKVVSVKFN